MHVMEQTAIRPVGASSRRAFLGKGMALGVGTMGAALLSNTLMFDGVSAASGEITDGDVAILRWLAAAELIEADLWNQYAIMARDNPDYNAALSNVDDSSPRYALDATDDEVSHHMLINAFLKANGKQEVNFDKFRTIPSPKVSKGGTKTPNLTDLTNLTVDTSWWARYRSDQNPDFGATSPQLVTIQNRPAIPTKDGITGDAMQAIADVALFHFPTIEQGGTSLYSTLALKVSNVDVLRILVSIGPVEAFHFATFEGSLESLPPLDVPATATSPAMHFPDLKNNHTEVPDNLDAAGVMPDPCTFLRKDLPQCSVVRPTSVEKGGAVAAAHAFIDMGLFMGQPKAFTDMLLDLATAADRAKRTGDE
jgi:hypothetical protein